MRHFLLLIFFSPILLMADPLFETRDCYNSLLYDLEVARYWDEKMDERLPLTFNHLLSTGYFTTPSARMSDEGEIAFGGAHVPPYNYINGRIQPFRQLEFSANYRIFQGVEDPGLSKKGFGDYADRGANFKFALFLPEDSGNCLPGIAFGIEDFMGSKKFTTYFVVGTQVWTCLNLETSFGWGSCRYADGPSHGFFGGAAWFPLWKCKNRLVEGLSFAVEYDPVDYKNPKKEPHPDGRKSLYPINYGVKWSYSDLFYVSASKIRGDAYAFAGSFHYNWGQAEGFFPKINDPLPYTAPRVTEPVGCYRPEAVMIQELNYAFEDQGFFLTNAWIEEGFDECGYFRNTLWISVMNRRYRQEEITKDRIQHLLAALTPKNLSHVIVIIESYGLPCQQYVYSRELLERFGCHRIGPYEFEILTPRQEVQYPCCEDSRQIFYNRLDPWRFRLGPRMETFFGSSSGKFKYDLGIKGDCEGFLPWNIYYELQLSYTVLSTIKDVGDFDLYNPSQLPNVLTDYVNYRKRRVFSTDKAFIQKNWNIGDGFFMRVSGGYFQVNYAGLSGEILYYPVNTLYAIGLEGAILKKRRYNGLWFQSHLRILDGYTPTYRRYNFLEQYFLNFYFDIPEWKIATKLGVGYFLARDKGGRLEVTRYFESGLRITGWLTYTDAKDNMHGEAYFNRGIALELPLDIFSRCRHRRVWNYGMAAWLRDAGAFISTGKPLFDIINRERRW